MPIILVAGATGLLGSEICRQLRAAGKSVKGLVRESSDRTKVDRLRSFGVETVMGDLRDRVSLDEACQGVTHVITTVSAVPFSYEPGVNDLQTTDVEGTTNLIEAAKSHGVSQFIFTSIRINVAPDCPLTSANREVERRLQESGLVYTILRPSFFMEAWLSPAVGFDPAKAKAVIYGTGQNPISWIAIQDVARFAVQALLDPGLKGRILEIGGTQNATNNQVAELYGKCAGVTPKVSHMPAAIAKVMSIALKPLHPGMSRIMYLGSLPDDAFNEKFDATALLAEFPIRLTTLEEFIEEQVKEPKPLPA